MKPYIRFLLDLDRSKILSMHINNNYDYKHAHVYYL
jgi:hypothetical protein